MELFGKNLETDVVFIAEIGVNHEGSLDKAIEMVGLAKEAGADVVKFQSYTPDRYVSRMDADRFERITRFALDEAAHDALVSEADRLGIRFLSTAVSEDWVPYIAANADAIKIASGDLTHEPVIRSAAESGKAVIMSVGLGTIDEIDRAVAWVADTVGESALADRLVLMHCVSAYPTPLAEANVSNVPYLRERYGVTAGYSNHVIGSSACLAAVALGAPVIEVHFTDQKEGRTFRDHALSFEQDDLKALIDESARIRQAIGVPGTTRQPCEIENLTAARKGIVAARDLASGARLKKDDLLFARPAVGFASAAIDDVIGQTLVEDVPNGHPILPEHLA